MPTPDMGLILPVPSDLIGPTPGPQWAHELNTALTVVDGHDHSAGAGAPIAIQAAGGLLRDGITNALGIKLDGPSLVLGPAGLKTAATISGINTGDVTLGTANGLVLTPIQVLSMTLAASGVTGALSGVDYTRLENTSGTNTGDVTLGAANGLSLVGQALSMALASAVSAGTVSIGAQTFAGSKTFSSAIKGQPEAEALLGGGSPTFANNYAVTYNPDGTVGLETWTDSNTTFLRKQLDYTYAGGLILSIRTRIYSAGDGITVVGDMTETFSYSGGQLVSSTTTRSV